MAEIKDRKRVMIDFDGTLRNSSTGEPTESAVKVIEELKKLGYEIFIFSTRVVYGGGNFIHEW